LQHCCCFCFCCGSSALSVWRVQA